MSFKIAKNPNFWDHSSNKFSFFSIPGEASEDMRWNDGESPRGARRKLGFFRNRWRRRRRRPCGGRAKGSSRPEPECRTRNRTGQGRRWCLRRVEVRGRRNGSPLTLCLCSTMNPWPPPLLPPFVSDSRFQVCDLRFYKLRQNAAFMIDSVWFCVTKVGCFWAGFFKNPLIEEIVRLGSLSSIFIFGFVYFNKLTWKNTVY